MNNLTACSTSRHLYLLTIYLRIDLRLLALPSWDVAALGEFPFITAGVVADDFPLLPLFFSMSLGLKGSPSSAVRCSTNCSRLLPALFGLRE